MSWHVMACHEICPIFYRDGYLKWTKVESIVFVLTVSVSWGIDTLATCELYEV